MCTSMSPKAKPSSTVIRPHGKTQEAETRSGDRSEGISGCAGREKRGEGDANNVGPAKMAGGRQTGEEDRSVCKQGNSHSPACLLPLRSPPRRQRSREKSNLLIDSLPLVLGMANSPSMMRKYLSLHPEAATEGVSVHKGR